MRKVVAVINLTIDGFCDHTAAIADAELHQHYTNLLKSGGSLLYGRVTYQMMESYWPTLVKNPTGVKADDDFAKAIQDIPKIVFSRTLKTVGWENASLAINAPEVEIQRQREMMGKDILVGSPSLIAALTKLNLFDEYQLCIHPVIAGRGLPLFKGIDEKIILKLKTIKNFKSGVSLHYYEPSSNVSSRNNATA
jgi:dihydrofolate reductase